MLYLSFKFVRKFKFCVSPLVKRYPALFQMLISVQCFLLSMVANELFQKHDIGLSNHYEMHIVSWRSNVYHCLTENDFLLSIFLSKWKQTAAVEHFFI